MESNTVFVDFVRVPSKFNVQELTKKLKSYFEQKSISGAENETTKVEVQIETDHGLTIFATVAFKHGSAVNMVLSRRDHAITIRGQTIDLEVKLPSGYGGQSAMGYSPISSPVDSNLGEQTWENEDDEEPEAQTESTVHVSNVGQDTSEETLRLYFENSRKSGGGEIVDMTVDEENATITFATNSVAQSVIARSHLLEGNTLTVVPVKQKKPRPKRPVDHTRLLLSGIPDDVSEEMLLLFIENCTKKAEDPQVIYGETPGTAMMTYSDEIDDLHNAIERFEKKRLKGQRITASVVYVPDCILVTHLKPGTSLDNVELYFENERRSGGGNVRDVDLDEERNQAIVYFEDWKVIDRVVRREHTMSKVKVTVCEFFDCLGTAISSDGPTPRIPEGVELNINPYLVKYILEGGRQYRPKIESEMKKEGALIIWPRNGNDDTVNVQPIQEKGVSIEWRHWKEKVTQRFMDIYSEFKAEKIAVQRLFWKEVCDKLKNINLNEVDALFDSERCNILLLGPTSEVERCKAVLTSIENDLETAAELEKQRIKRPMKLSPENLKLFYLCFVKESICQKWTNVHISTDSSSHQILLEGLKNDVAGAQADIYTQIESLKRRNVTVSSTKADFVKFVEDKVHEIFNSRSIHAACKIDRQQLTIVGATDKDVSRAISFITDDLAEDSIPLQEKDVLQSQHGTELLQDINNGKSVLTAIDGTRNVINISGFKADVEKCSGRLRVFLKENSVVRRHIPLPKGKLRYIDQHARQDLKSIAQDQHSVDVRTELHGSNFGLHVTGTTQGLQIVIPRLTNLVDSILERQYPITKPGIQDLLAQTNGKSILTKVQRDCQCVIDTHSTDDNDYLDAEQSISESAAQVLRCSNDCQLMVCKGDLTKEQVDAIVNAANTDLRHVGGLARAIVEKGGNSIQRESETIIQRKGTSLSTAEAVITGSGALPCNHIIHVAGPRWHRGRPEPDPNDPTTVEEDLLYDSITNVLSLAKSRNINSLSIPAISSGIYGFPVGLCAKTIVDAVLWFCDRNRYTSLKEIRFTNIDQRSCDAFLKVFQDRFGEKQPSKSFDSSNDYAGSKYRAVPPTDKDVLATKEGKRITLKRGNIATETVDIVVNTVGCTVQLTQGGVSNAIQAAAGPSLQQECDKALQQKGLTRLPTGDFITTRVGNLNCKAVYHIVCDNYGGPKSDQTLSTLMQTILQQANKDGNSSIAIPAIGTGHLGFPADVTAQLMYEEALHFSQQNPVGSLVDIRFVVYHQDHRTIKAFESEIKKQQGSNFQRRAGPGGQRFHRRLKKEQGSGYSASNDAVSPDTRRLKIGSVIVELQHGDITKETTDVIVNSVGHDLGLRGPVSQAILKAGGNQIKRECEEIQRRGGYYGRQDRDVFKTLAGRLPCKMIIHVATPHSTDKLKDAIWNALQLADQENCASIAFPALGTGVVAIGGNTTAAATAMVDAIGEYAVQGKPENIRLVKITIYKQEMFAVYKETLSSKIDSGNRPSKGMLRRGFEYVWSVISGSNTNEEEDVWENPSDDTIVLHIFAKSSRRIDEAFERIDDFIKREYYLEEIPLEKNLLGEMDDAKMNHIFGIGAKNKVEILPMLDGRAKRISIQGRDINVKSAHAEIQSYFTQIQLELKRKTEDQLINKEVQWKYKDTTGIFVEYGDEINPIIERAHREERPYVLINLEEGGILIDFETMTETAQGSGASAGAVDVHRCEMKNENTFRLPSNWSNMSGQNSTAVTLTAGPEMTQIQTSFQGLVGRQTTIYKIDRIQIVDLYKQYAAVKERMQTSLPNGVQAEKTLYQGVDHSVTNKINKFGFDRADYTRTQTSLGIGMGVYFGSNVAYIDQNYALASGPSGRKYMYICKVLTGVPEQGRQGMISPSQNPNNSGNPYDCAVDNVQNPTWFVVFKDGQAYPEYLIEYQ